jgi:hypothetical protein
MHLARRAKSVGRRVGFVRSENKQADDRVCLAKFTDMVSMSNSKETKNLTDVEFFG